MSNRDTESILSAPIYAFDFRFMIGDVKDFLDFSESNIAWQLRRELKAIAQRTDHDDLPAGYRLHLEEIANHRFGVSLPLRVRYGALLAFTASVECSMRFLNLQSVAPIPDKRDGSNHTVAILRELSARTQLAAKAAIDDYEALTNIRNCIAHSAGIVETYKFKETLPGSVARLRGFSLANWHCLGDQVCIERGALDTYIDQSEGLIVDLHSAMHEQGLMRP